MKQLSRIFTVLVWPSRGFSSVLERPRFWLAILVLIGGALASHAAIQSKIDPDAMARLTAKQQSVAMEKEGKDDKETTDSDLEEQAKRARAAMNIMGYIKIPVGVLFLVLGTGILFYVAFGAWRKKVRVQSCFALSAHAWLPLAIWHVLSVPVVLQYPSIDPAALRGLLHLDLAHLLGMQEGLPVLSWINPLVLWIAVLFAIAGRAMGRGKMHCTLVGFCFWLLLLGPQSVGLLGP
jgi:hypothetical protein